MNKTAVVFGATGLVGRELVSGLLESSDYDKVVAVVRKDLPDSDSRLEQIILPDYSQLSQFKDKLNAETYFCCIGTTIKTAGSKAAFRKVDLDIPVQIAKLAQELSVPSMVVISSLGALASSFNFYLQTKGEMENSVKTYYKGNIKVVRPSLLMGNRKEYRFGEKAALNFMKVFGWMFAGPFSKYRGISARDVAKAMIKIAGLPQGKVTYESGELREMASR
jgi:uncharacterized protein YbjT (DUF2867 family)